MIRHFTCIVCPKGCEIEVGIKGQKILFIKGEDCNKGKTYVQEEIYNPKRNIASSIAVIDGDIPLVSVRLTNPIPKEKIFDVIEEIKKVKLYAPIYLGQAIIENILDLDSNVIATKDVKKIHDKNNPRT